MTRRNSIGGVIKHRHSVGGGYARGEETRERIVNAALKVFGERGFDRASTRGIATAGGVNASALPYYFDNKEGVYLACVEYIGERVWEYMAEVIERAERAIAGDADDADLIEALCAIHSRLAEFVFAEKHPAEWPLFMARLQSGEGPPAGLQFFHKFLTKRLSAVSSMIVGGLLGRPADDEETLIRTMAVSEQLAVFQRGSRGFLALLNWDAIGAERQVLLKRVLREQIMVLLGSMVASRVTRVY